MINETCPVDVETGMRRENGRNEKKQILLKWSVLVYQTIHTFGGPLIKRELVLFNNAMYNKVVSVRVKQRRRFE